MTTLDNAKRNAIDVRLGVVGADKEKPNKESCSLGTDQDIYFAWMRHDGLKAEAAFRLNTGVASAISNDLSLSDTFVVSPLQLTRNIVGIDVLAERDTLLQERPEQGGFSGAVGTGNHQEEWIIQLASRLRSYATDLLDFSKSDFLGSAATGPRSSTLPSGW